MNSWDETVQLTLRGVLTARAIRDRASQRPLPNRQRRRAPLPSSQARRATTRRTRQRP